MRKSIDFASLSGVPDGDPLDPVEGVFEAQVKGLRIEPFKHKNGASGFQSVFIVHFEGAVREIVVQHPFLHPKEEKNKNQLQKRQERWLAVVQSLTLNVEEAQALCNHLYEPIVPEKHIENWTSLNPDQMNQAKRQKWAETQKDLSESLHVLAFMSIGGKGRRCWVEIRDKKKGRKFPEHRFLTPKGYEHQKENYHYPSPTGSICTRTNPRGSPRRIVV